MSFFVLNDGPHTARVNWVINDCRHKAISFYEVQLINHAMLTSTYVVNFLFALGPLGLRYRARRRPTGD